METGRKGLCINVGNCKNADSKLPVEVSVAADFVCPECGRDLVPVEQKKKMAIPKPVLIGVIALLVLLGGGIGGYFLLSGDDNDDVKGKVQTVNTSSNKKTNETAAVPTDKPAAAPVTEPGSTSTTPGDNNNAQQTPPPAVPVTHTIPPPPPSNNPVQVAFDKLADGSSYSAKDGLINSTLGMFTGNSAKAYTIGENGTVVSDMPISDLLETMRIRNKHFVFIDGVSNGGKYSSIRVKAN